MSEVKENQQVEEEQQQQPQQEEQQEQKQEEVQQQQPEEQQKEQEQVQQEQEKEQDKKEEEQKPVEQQQQEQEQENVQVQEQQQEQEKQVENPEKKEEEQVKEQQQEQEQQQKQEEQPKQEEEVTKQPQEQEQQQQPEKKEEEQVQQQQEQQQSQPESQPQQQQQQQQQQEEDDDSEISVYVVDPVVKDNVRNYVIYTVRGQDRDGPFEIVRRFNDFYSLKTSLINRWPGCFVPPVPEKKARGNFEPAFVEERRQQLQKFMQKLSQLKHLWYGEEMNVFIRTNCNDVEATLNTLPKMTYDNLIKKYEEKFVFLSGKEINTDIIVNISNFGTYLKKTRDQLKNYKEMCKSLIKETKNQNHQYDLLTNYLLPEYEKNSLCEYLDGQTQGRLIFQDEDESNNELNQLFVKLKDFVNDTELDGLYELLRYELKELESFMETMQIRAHYEMLKQKSINKKGELNQEMSNLMSNKTTVKGLFSTKNKQDQMQSIQNKIEYEDLNINNLTLICEIITVILGYVEIDRFKQEKVGLYYDTIRKVAKHELEHQTKIGQMWKQVLDNPNLI